VSINSQRRSLRKTDVSSGFAHHREYSALEQETHQSISDLTQPEVVPRGAGKHHYEPDDEKDACEEIHRRLVGYQRVDMTAEMSTSADQNRKNNNAQDHDHKNKVVRS